MPMLGRDPVEGFQQVKTSNDSCGGEVVNFLKNLSQLHVINVRVVSTERVYRDRCRRRVPDSVRELHKSTSREPFLDKEHSRLSGRVGPRPVHL